MVGCRCAVFGVTGGPLHSPGPSKFIEYCGGMRPLVQLGILSPKRHDLLPNVINRNGAS